MIIITIPFAKLIVTLGDPPIVKCVQNDSDIDTAKLEYDITWGIVVPAHMKLHGQYFKTKYDKLQQYRDAIESGFDSWGLPYDSITVVGKKPVIEFDPDAIY